MSGSPALAPVRSLRHDETGRLNEPAQSDNAPGHLEHASPVPPSHRDRPGITVRRSGAGSAHPVVLLQKAAFRQAANLAEGMLRWRASGYPVVGAE